jgi:hypothetical protein
MVFGWLQDASLLLDSGAFLLGRWLLLEHQAHHTLSRKGEFETGPALVHLGCKYRLYEKLLVQHRRSTTNATLQFIGCDIVSILTQAAGGGIASAATMGDNLLDVGNGLIMAGIAFQVATMATCIILTTDFAFRLARNRRNKDFVTTGTPEALGNTKFLFYLGCSALGFMTIFIRCVYRYASYPVRSIMYSS